MNLENIDIKNIKPQGTNSISWAVKEIYGVKQGNTNKKLEEKQSPNKDWTELVLRLASLKESAVIKYKVTKDGNLADILKAYYKDNNLGISHNKADYQALIKMLNPEIKNLSEIASGQIINLPNKEISKSLNKILTDNNHYPFKHEDIMDDSENLELSLKNKNNPCFKPGEINQGAINQGSVFGDCWFLSSLAALAKTKDGAQMIADMVTKNKDGSYTVVFPGDKLHPVKVTMADILSDKLLDSRLWAQIIEAAVIKKYPDKVRNGADPSLALELLTGKQYDYYDLKSLCPFDTNQELINLINKAISSNTPLVAVTKKGNYDKNFPVIFNHAYTVEGIKYINGQAEIILRNPWGNYPGDNSMLAKIGSECGGVTNLGNGEIAMSIDTFKQYFVGVNVSATLELTHFDELKGLVMSGFNTLEKYIKEYEARRQKERQGPFYQSNQRDIYEENLSYSF